MPSENKLGEKTTFQFRRWPAQPGTLALISLPSPELWLCHWALALLIIDWLMARKSLDSCLHDYVTCLRDIT